MKQIGDRIELGEGRLGNVFIFEFANDPDKAVRPGGFFEVRMGNHTIAKKDTLEAAMVVAKALTLAEEPSEPAKSSTKARAAASSR